MQSDEYKQARRAAMEARERGEVKHVEPTRAAPYLPEAVIYERPKGWRKLFIGVRQVATRNSAMRRIAGSE